MGRWQNQMRLAAHTCSHCALEVLIVTNSAQHEPHKHQHCQEVALSRGLIVVYHVEQEIDEDWSYKLTSIVDQLEGDSSSYQSPCSLPTSPCLQEKRNCEYMMTAEGETDSIL